MKVHILDLKPVLAVAVSGAEAWLEPIYKDFPLPGNSGPGEKPGKISGNLRVTLVTDDIVRVEGHLDYAPLVDCSRCLRPIEWPLALDLDVYYQKRGVEELPRDITLRKGELDEYYFDGEIIDLAELVNDAVQTALPTRFVPEDDEGTSCYVCHMDLSEEQVYGEKEEAEEAKHPFAALKNLKPKH